MLSIDRAEREQSPTEPEFLPPEPEFEEEAPSPKPGKRSRRLQRKGGGEETTSTRAPTTTPVLLKGNQRISCKTDINMIMLLLCKNAVKMMDLPREAGVAIEVDIYDNNLRKLVN
ncbi:UNVERIFIED_CONTAM: hypothetical protein FKN15_028126 [Acipenser sinensis]